jgi:HYR domain
MAAIAGSGHRGGGPMKRAFLLFAAALGSLAVAAVRADADSVGTFQVNGTFGTKFDRVDCPAGTPATTACHRSVSVRAELIPGLGEVTMAYTLVLDDFGSACMHLHAELLPILVAGKGEIDLAARSTGCITPDQLGGRLFSLELTVSGGSGRYAGASGSGVLDNRNHDQTGPEAGSSTITWTGTLNVAGLTFDTTQPQIAGATSKVVKTRLAAGARVRYSVSATDATDGPVPAACLPKSGSVFRVGRTTVTCTPVDSSGNTATARFVITVKRVRR